MLKFNNKIFFLGITFLLISLVVVTSANFTGSYTLTAHSSNSKSVPFNDFYLYYSLKAEKDGMPIYNIGLIINYTRLTDNASSNFDFKQNMVFRSFLLAFIGESQENATFFENSTNRLMQINNTEGQYIEWLIYHVAAYNSTENALNWDPFWIIPQDVNQTYPIYSFNFNLTQRTYLTPSDLPLFATSRPVLIFNGQQQVFGSYENISNTFGLIYDNETGILLKGNLDSVIIGTNATNHYSANFDLTKTNIFPTKSSNTSGSNPIDNVIPKQLQKPNYLLLFFIIALPILITISRLFRLKEVSGGKEKLHFIQK